LIDAQEISRVLVQHVAPGVPDCAMNMMTITKVSPDEFSKDVDRYIGEANTLHKVFEIPGVDEKSVVVLSKQDFEGWQETIHLLSSQANAQALLESIAELDAK
jgi:antitoxin YefM